MSMYITQYDYNVIRESLISMNTIELKFGIQKLIELIEYGRLLSMHCTKDLCAIMYSVVKNPDYKIRKWAYHLVIYKHDKLLVYRCIQNLTTHFETDAENVSWIFAIASTLLSPDQLLHLYTEYGKDSISKYTFDLATTIFSEEEAKLDINDISKIVDSSSFLDKMWLTKIYACKYMSFKKRKFAEVVNNDVMNAFIHDPSMERYALWAFSTLEEPDIETIEINPHNASKLSSASLAWYYTILFKDNNYISSNIDHIVDVLEKFFKYPIVVQIGILRGLYGSNATTLHHSLVYLLIEIFTELDEEYDEMVPILIHLINILTKYESSSLEITDILDDYSANTHNDSIKTILWRRTIVKMKGVTNNMGAHFTINGPVGGIQTNEGGEQNVQNNSLVLFKASSTYNPETIKNFLTEVQEMVNDSMFDNYFADDSDDLSVLANKLNYEFDSLRKTGTVNNDSVLSKLNEIEDTLKNMFSEKEKSKKKSVFWSFVGKCSDLVTLSTGVPQLLPVLKNTVSFIKTFLMIS